MRRSESQFWPHFFAWLAPAVTAVAVPLELSRAVGLFAPATPKVWTERELQDRFLLRSMDDIRAEMGPPDFTSVDRNGDIGCLRYYRVKAAPDGRLRDVYFFAHGNRCDGCGFDGPR